MQQLIITIIGQDLFKLCDEKFKLVMLNPVNQANKGMLGNLKTLTYFFFELDEDEVIEKRSGFLNLVAEDHLRMMALFKAGDWMRIFIIRPL